jgi:hypothetical protein
MRALRRGLRHGLAPLLPACCEDGDPLGEVKLLDQDGLLCDAVEDLGREHLVPQQALMEYWPWARLRAEQEEQQLYAEIRRLPPDDYAKVRELLASDPVAEQGVLWEKWDGLWGRFGFFEPVSSWPWCNAAAGYVELDCSGRAVGDRRAADPTVEGAATGRRNAGHS